MVHELEGHILSLMQMLNRRDLSKFHEALAEDCVLDMPGGSRVIGRDSVRDTLSEFLLRRDLRLTDIVAMADPSGTRGAAELVLHAGESDAVVSVASIIALEFEDGRFQRLSFYTAVPV